jgi:uncharacterized protein (TIGR03435 family)
MMVARGAIEGSGVTMAQLVQMLGNNVGGTVVDKTGLTGRYEVKLAWSPEPGQGGGLPGLPPAGGGGAVPPPPDPSLPSIFTAIQEQLGLRIESSRGPVEVFVIDGAEKPVEE